MVSAWIRRRQQQLRWEAEQADAQRRLHALRADLLHAKAPEFMRQMVEAIEREIGAVNEHLGTVVQLGSFSRTATDGCEFSKTPFPTAQACCELDRPAEAIRVSIHRTLSDERPPEREDLVLRLTVGEEDAIIANGPAGRKLREPDTVAACLVEYVAFGEVT